MSLSTKDNSFKKIRGNPHLMKSLYFPPVKASRGNDGEYLYFLDDLSVPVLLDAYQHGIFPWPSPGYPVAWYSPDPRSILPLEKAHFHKRLLRTIRNSKWKFTIDTAFEEVIHACSLPRSEDDGVWITASMQKAYIKLHKCGYAHSVEVWDPESTDESGRPELIGGVYGVGIKRFFAGESMFHTRTDASKAALWFLVQTLKERGCELFDVQVANSHTLQFGVIDISQEEYLCRLKDALS